MKMYNFIVGAGIVLLAAACESTRQTTTSDNTSTDRSSSITQPEASTATPGNATSSTTNPSTANNNSSATPASTSPATSGNPGSANTNTQQTTNNPSGNATSVSGNTMANSTMNSTTRGDTTITPPSNVQSSFSTKYPKASNVRWYQYNSTNVPIDWDLTGWPALTNRDYAVRYDVDNNQHYAWYDAQGNWIGSTSHMTDMKNLPAAISSMISSKYAGYNITDVHTETYKDRSAYQIELAKGTDKVKMVVDVNGNVLKQKTKTVDASGNETKEKTKIQNK